MEWLDSINKLDTREISDASLYLLFSDGRKLNINRAEMERYNRGNNGCLCDMPLCVKSTENFSRCSICPEKQGVCDALIPLIPYIEIFDNYNSFDKVTAVFKKGDLTYVSKTTVQEAVRYVSILGLMQYCLVGKKYWKCFLDVIPLMPFQELYNRLYLNVYWLNKGDSNAIDSFIKLFAEDITITTKNIAKRLNVICKSDAFLNSFVNMHIGAKLLTLDIDKVLMESFNELEQESFIQD